MFIDRPIGGKENIRALGRDRGHQGGPGPTS